MVVSPDISLDSRFRSRALEKNRSKEGEIVVQLPVSSGLLESIRSMVVSDELVVRVEPVGVIVREN